MALEQMRVPVSDQDSDEQSTGEQHRQYLLQVLSKEMELIGEAILDRNRQSTQIKQWCLTLWLAAWGILSIEHVTGLLVGRQHLALLAPVVFPPFFFVLSLINKRRERKFTYRARLINAFLNAGVAAGNSGDCSLKAFVEKGELGNFRFYDPAAMNWLKQKGGPIGDHTTVKMKDWLSFRQVILGSWGYIWFYGGLTAISLVPFFLVTPMRTAENGHWWWPL